MNPHAHDVSLGGVPTQLKLTVGGFANIVKRLNCETPTALSQALREADAGAWNIVLSAVANPPPRTPLESHEIARLLPELSALIVESFA